MAPESTNLPKFDFTRDDLYGHWRRIYMERGVELSLDTFLEIRFEQDPAFDKEYDWVPISTVKPQMRPRRRRIRGYEFLEPLCTPAALTTAELLVRFSACDEDFACISILACTYQLELQREARWDGRRSRELLCHAYVLCDNHLYGWPGQIWKGQPKRIFPERFFSQRLLESTPSLTDGKLVELAVLSMQYYLSQWVIVKYRYPDDRLESLRRLQTDAVNLFAEALSPPSQELAESRPDEMQRLAEGSLDAVGETRLLILDREEPKSYVEGSRRAMTQERIERNRLARKVCLEHFGAVCQVCGTDFAKYGPQFAGLIDVHHVKPMSATDGEREVDPIRDLVPLCPNCHRMIHRKPHGVYTVEELKELVNGPENR